MRALHFRPQAAPARILLSALREDNNLPRPPPPTAKLASSESFLGLQPLAGGYCREGMCEGSAPPLEVVLLCT
jgi:hypothetical protein